MKSRFLLLFLMLFITNLIASQTVHDPNSDIYRDIDRWFVQGYVRQFLPLTRPYPAPLVINILDEVISNGNAGARQKATEYKEMLVRGSRIIHPGFLSHMQGKNEDYGLIFAPFAEGHFYLHDLLTASYSFYVYGITDEDGERFNVPHTYTPYADFIPDDADVGSIILRQNWTSLVAFGKSDIYIQAGLSRTSVGPFYDNSIIVGPQAPKAGHLSFVFRKPMWSLEMLFLTLSASDDFGQDDFAGKYSIVHNISFRPFKSLELGFIQAMIWGGRFEVM